MAERQFRQDLFFRLNVIAVQIAPLRDREHDVRLLAEHFITHAATGAGRTLSSAAYAVLAHYSWPGNVRELKNLIERLLATSTQAEISAEAVSSHLASATQLNATLASDDLTRLSPSLHLPTAIEQLEMQYIRAALQQAEGNRSDAAKILGITRQLLYSKLEKYQLE